MYRDEHEAALRRAEALEREVRDLRERADASADTAARLEALQAEIASARARLATSSDQLTTLEGQLDALRARTPGAKMARATPGAEGGARWPIFGGVVLGALILPSLVAAIVAYRSGPSDVASAHPTDVPDEPAPADDPRPRDVRAREAYDAGARALAAGDTAGAREAFERAHSIYPPLAEPHRELGLLHLKEGDLGAMCTELATYLALAPDAADAAHIRATAAAAPGPQRCHLPE
jgi:hypothetical protein